MIPRIAHFHWEGKPMPWLRMMGLYTFIRLNPRWEVVLHRTPEHMRKANLPCHANEADWVWLEAVYEHGGFALATDTVFVRPMPEEWLEGDFCGSPKNNKLYHCCFGAKKGHEFVGACVQEARQVAAISGIAYQDLGITLFDRMIEKRGGLSQMFKNNPESFVHMETASITPVPFYEARKCWGSEDLSLPETAIGVTWFGGDKSSKTAEWGAEKTNSAIVRLARKVIGE